MKERSSPQLFHPGRLLSYFGIEETTAAKSYGFTLSGQMPSGKNAVMVNPKTGRHYPQKRFVDWRKKAIDELNRQQGPLDPIDQPCRITVAYVRGDNRRRDVPGMMDALCHLFEKAGWISDDKHLVEWEWLPTEGDEAMVYGRITLLEEHQYPPKAPPTPRTS